MVADWWGVETTKGISENEFVEQVTQQYAYVQVVNTVQEKGYAVEEQTTNEDGSISLKVGKWG
jgi:hypothetical protein